MVEQQEGEKQMVMDENGEIIATEVQPGDHIEAPVDKFDRKRAARYV
jgi:hypothetical protein